MDSGSFWAKIKEKACADQKHAYDRKAGANNIDMPKMVSAKRSYAHSPLTLDRHVLNCVA